MQTNISWQGQELETLLTKQFRIGTGFQPGQRDIIERLLQGQRILAIQRTGWGKSLCYQLASVCLPHLTLVFSPLKALMRDQCQRCNDTYAIPSGLVCSDNSLEEIRATFTQAMAGRLKILFLAPERLDRTDWQRYVTKMKISLLVIDEAHCISTWGHNFRPHYRRIIQMVDSLATDTPILTLTATANKRVEADIKQQLGTAKVIRGPLQRPNLFLHIVRLNGDWEKLCYLATVLEQRKDTGIIYTVTQYSAMMIALFLCSYGIKAEYYHANRDDAIRRSIEQSFMTNQYHVLCATNALGMGLDKANIRFVIHYHVPASLIDYYQEIGRAGRDNKQAWCILLYDPADITQQERRIEQGGPHKKQYAEVLALLQAHSQGTHEHNLLLNTGLSQIKLRIILADLLEQELIKFNGGTRRYTLIPRLAIANQKPAILPEQIDQLVDFSIHERIKREKLDELVALQQYAHTAHCYMAYLSNYLGDMTGYDRCGVCSNCSPQLFPNMRSSPRIQAAVTQFLEKDFLPRIERTEEGAAHEAGWSLSYHSGSRIGQQVHACKYQGAGPFPLGLVLRAAEIAQTCYPVQNFHAVASIPPTKSGTLVEDFAQQIAERLGVEYFPSLVKTRPTYLQMRLTNRVQKANNVQGVFAVMQPEKLVRCTVLLIDDTYDSGYTLYEAGKALMEAGAQAVYPLTITRTLHTDNEQK